MNMAKILLTTALMGVALARKQCESVAMADVDAMTHTGFETARDGKSYTVVALLQAY